MREIKITEVRMAEVIGVRFKEVGKVYYFDPNGIQMKKAIWPLWKLPAVWNAARSRWKS